MKNLTGKYADAKVFTDNIEIGAEQQIVELLNQPFVDGAKVRIMPDCHKGSGCVIGFTADLGDKVIPNLIGVDIGCGMFVVELGKEWFSMTELDRIIHEYVPAGFNIHDEEIFNYSYLKELLCLPFLKSEKFRRAIGTLGGGNHFIEVDIDDNGVKYLVIHSGSRNLGKQVAEFYQSMAVDSCRGLGDLGELKRQAILVLKEQGKANKIPFILKEMEDFHKKTNPMYPKDLCFLEGEQRENYLHDMKICQEYASLNRYMISNIITQNMLGAGTSDFPYFSTIHNYVDLDTNIIRKGAVSAQYGERLIIPINMRDGSIIAVGKGNPDWNFSAPHGAGRLMGRMEAKRKLSMSLFEEQMEGIYTTTVNESTLDEAPFAYKSMDEILSNIGDTAEVEKIIKPIYNFKSAE